MGTNEEKVNGKATQEGAVENQSINQNDGTEQQNQHADEGYDTLFAVGDEKGQAICPNCETTVLLGNKCEVCGSLIISVASDYVPEVIPPAEEVIGTQENVDKTLFESKPGYPSVEVKVTQIIKPKENPLVKVEVVTEDQEPKDEPCVACPNCEKSTPPNQGYCIQCDTRIPNDEEPSFRGGRRCAGGGGCHSSSVASTGREDWGWWPFVLGGLLAAIVACLVFRCCEKEPVVAPVVQCCDEHFDRDYKTGKFLVKDYHVADAVVENEENIVYVNNLFALNKLKLSQKHSLVEKARADSCRDYYSITTQYQLDVDGKQKTVNVFQFFYIKAGDDIQNYLLPDIDVEILGNWVSAAEINKLPVLVETDKDLNYKKKTVSFIFTSKFYENPKTVAVQFRQYAFFGALSSYKKNISVPKPMPIEKIQDASIKVEMVPETNSSELKVESLELNIKLNK